MTPSSTLKESESIRATVREGYAAIARSEAPETSSCCGPSCCGGGADNSATALAAAIGYDAQELAEIPQGANMGLSCGNPTALAELTAGEVVVDLGSGGGFDVFIAGRKVGPTGRAIGVDMTHDMLARARRNQADYEARTGMKNVEFRVGEIEHLPLADASADAVISNCVINLSPDKPQVWREIARVLKPGGRVAVSDLALLRPLPEAVRSMVEALVGCIAGAVLVEETERAAREAGLMDIELETKGAYFEQLKDWKDPLYLKIAEALPAGTSVGDYVTSLNVRAKKLV
jgi:SAM-dependent methyltransferase